MLESLLPLLLEPFSYNYMSKAIWISALVGGICAFLSCYLILKGWALMGDALSHSVVPGVATAYLLNWPYAVGAFFTGGLAALAILFVRHFSRLRGDAIIGLVFSAFLASGLLIASLNPISINIESIIFGNILGIADNDVWQILIISAVVIATLLLLWKDLMLLFFDETHARTIGLRPLILKTLFFILLSASVVASIQTVGAILVIAMLITPGSTAYLLTDRFGWMIVIAVMIGVITSWIGAYLSFFLNGSTGGLIVLMQVASFFLAYLFAPKHGIIAQRYNQRHNHQRTQNKKSNEKAGEEEI